MWEHLEIGYMQGMCDLVAPLLVIFDDESLSYSCFCHLMERMIENFPNGNAMDMHLANMRYIIRAKTVRDKSINLTCLMPHMCIYFLCLPMPNRQIVDTNTRLGNV